ncbi:MAG: hypothetical protein NTW02_13970, partial [Cyanobium sp. LacPavin_0920_WC12_MAG_62_9]|nr:hypothetical protein [Cyanobium sp. LacPavin_0920_WC12_MAG_62_9]
MGATVTDSQGIFTYNLTQQNIEAIGTNPGKTVSASQKDSSGNISSSAPIAAKTPVKPPEFSVLQLGGDDSTVTTIDGDSVLSGKANPNTKTTISLNGKLLAEVTSDALGLFKYSLSPQDIVSLGQGVNKKLIVSQTDLYGQVGSKDFIFSVDTIAPTLSLKGQMGGVDKTVSSLPLDNIITGMTDERLLTLAFGNQVLTTITPDRIGAFQLSLDASIISKVGEGISKVFNLFAVDGVGNKTSIEFTCDIDITPPAKPGNLSVGGHDSTISLKSGDNILTSKVEANTSLYVYSDTVLIANFVVAPDASLTSYQFTNDQLKSIGDGSHELVLKSVDKAGNFSLSDSLLYTIDRTPPTLVFNGKLGGADETISTQLSDNLVFGNTDASSYQLVYDNQVISEKSVNSNGQIALEISSDLIDIIGQGDNKLLTVLVSDKAGNETSKLFVFAVDTIPPNPPVISSVGGLDSTLTTFSKDNIISGSSDPNSVVSLFVDYKFLADVKCDSKGIFSLALSKDNILSLGDGLGKVLTAKVSDIAGNTSFSNQFSFSVDTTPPPAPVILSVGGTDSTISTAGSLNNMPTVDNKIVGTSEALTTVSFFNSKGVLLGSTNADSNGKFEYAFTSSNISSLGQGAKKVVSAVARDSVGYSSISSASLEFNIDTIAPNAPLIKSVGGADNIITLQPSDNTIQGSSSPGDTVNLKAVSTTGFSLDLGTVLVSNTGLFSFALSVDQIKQIDGANASLIQASVTDVAGNVGRSTFNLDVDITPPQIVFNQIGGIDNVVSSVVGDATIRGSADPVSKVVIGSGSRVFGEVTSLADGSFSYNLSSTDISFLGQGLARSIYASQFDRAGNFSKQFGSFAVDTIAPAIPLVKSVGGIDSIVTSNLGDRSVVVSADRDTTIDIVYVSGSSRSVLSSMAVGSSGTVTYELSASDLESIRQGVGKAIQVNARDAAGNASTSRPLSFSVEASWNKGSSTDDSLNFKSGLDVLTGLGGSNTFKVDKLTSAIAVSTMSQLS